MSPQTKKRIEARLNRVTGQVSGIQRMVENDRYCVDILMQISAARAALTKVSKMLLESHIQTCVTEAFESSNPEDCTAKMDELIRIFEKSCTC